MPTNPLTLRARCTAGVSLSSLQRSSVQINPDCKEADDLREWWCSAGAVASFAHAGEGLASARKCDH